MTYSICDCPLCGGREFRAVLKARDYHYGNPGEFTLVECQSCTLCFLDPMYDDDELATFYPQNYYAFVDRFTPKTFPPFRKFVRSILGIREFQTRDPQFLRPGRMLDVGCGSGWFIYQMRERGWEVAGVEPSAAAAEYGRSEKGLDIFHGSLIDAAFETKKFDYIRVNHAFEHMSRPNAILDEIHRILADDGQIMIGVPNRASFNARVFGPYWYHLALPLHAFVYSTFTISQMLEKHSFRLTKITYNTDNAGLQGSIQFFLNRNEEPPKPEGFFTSSRVARVLTFWGAHIQNLLRIADSIEVIARKS